MKAETQAISTLLVAGALVASFAYSGEAESREEIGSDELRGQEVAAPTPPTMVPPPITRSHATKVIVNLEAVERVVRVADGSDYTRWTFGENVPGSLIRVREGDLVELNLHNHPDNRMPHSIDLRSVTGSTAGSTSAFAAPGDTSELSFEVPHPGLFIYHCATAPVGRRVVNQMHGLILAEPREGLSDGDGEHGDQNPVGNLLQRMLKMQGFERPQIVAARSKDELMALGESVYRRACLACHQEHGQGIPGAFPPLARSDYLMADKKRSIEIVTRGLQGKITVNGVDFDGVMPALALSDDEVANVLTFVRNSWNDAIEMVTPEDVKAVRNAGFKQ